MFIDIHVHARRIAGPPETNGLTYATPEQLLRQYDQLSIEAGVLLPGVSPECAHVPQSNEEVLEVCAAYPGRFVPFCNVDPRALTNSPDAPLGNLLRWYKERGCRGVGEVTANLAFLDPLVQNLFKHAEQVRLPLIFHIATQLGGTYGLYDEPGLAQLEKCLQAFPNLTFLGHSPPFWAEIAALRETKDRGIYPKYPVEEEGAVPRLMRRYPNLLGDLSAGSGHNALARDPAYAARFLSEFQDRLFFGTDICAPGQDVPQVKFLLDLREQGRISPAVFDKVARENAARLLAIA
jgi:predicted TIM-barrel fold metal-dependent hydrolase